jgi:hypothetical protein
MITNLILHTSRMFLVSVMMIPLGIAAAQEPRSDTPNDPAPGINTCSLAPCNFQECVWQRDTRDCSQVQQPPRDCFRCLMSGFGRCIQRGNDPICEAQNAADKLRGPAAVASCEAAKAAQNAAYDATHAACISSAVRQKVACEAARAACERASRQ